jgi:hypothetical protein
MDPTINSRFKDCQTRTNSQKASHTSHTWLLLITDTHVCCSTAHVRFLICFREAQPKQLTTLAYLLILWLQISITMRVSFRSIVLDGINSFKDLILIRRCVTVPFWMTSTLSLCFTWKHQVLEQSVLDCYPPCRGLWTTVIWTQLATRQLLCQCGACRDHEARPSFLPGRDLEQLHF